MVEISEDKVKKGEELFIKFLKLEGKYMDFIRLLHAGKHTEAHKMATDVVDKHRAEFDKEMNL